MPISLTASIDLGGTKVETALVDPEGVVVVSSRRASGLGLEPAQFLQDTATTLVELQETVTRGRIEAVSLGVAGQVDSHKGLVLESPNLPKWKDVYIRQALERTLNIPGFAVNDVQAATWGEWQKGAGKGVSELVCMFVGTGIGGGIVANGQLYTGTNGSAGEIGHIVLDYQGPQCRCGNRGCLEAHAGGWAIARSVEQMMTTDPKVVEAMLTLPDGKLLNINAESVGLAAHRGDAVATRLVAQVGEALGAGVVSVINSLNPAMVIMGGSVVRGLPELIDMVKGKVRRAALLSARTSVEIVSAELGDYAVVVGAALMARKWLG
jgi:glucokinase